MDGLVKKVFFQNVKTITYHLLTILFLCLKFSSAFALDLAQPIDCKYGKDCFISNYFDHDEAPKSAKDHVCGAMSTDGYKSTDFMLKSVAQMKEGVNVVAGDAGVIKGVRNDVADVSVELSGVGAVKGRECGNGVVIEHKRGYETQYCHLKYGSVVVKRGDKVEKGQIIGQVGLSGLTNFPYLEFTVKMNGKQLDPFTGEDAVSGKAEVACDSQDIYPLWDKATEKSLTYVNTAVLSSGFSSKVPNALGAREGKYTSKTIYNNTKLLSFWVDILGVSAGDKLRITVNSPEGTEIYNDTKAFAAEKRHLFQFIGVKLDEDKTTWPVGQYTARVELIGTSTGKDRTLLDSSTLVDIVEPEAEGEEKKQ